MLSPKLELNEMDEAMEDVLKTTLSNNVTMTRIRMKRRELCILVVERRGVLSWYDPSTVIKSFFEDRRRRKNEARMNH